MSKVIEGYLEETESKEGKTKRGKPWTAYRGKVGGTWVSFGFNHPQVSKGDYIRVTLVENNGYEEVSEAVKVDPPKKVEVPPAAHAAGGSAPASNVDRQASIIYQSSRKDALALVASLVALDAVPITAAKTAAGKAKRYEEVMALVDKLTVRYFYDCDTLRILQNVADDGAAGPAPEGLPEDAQAAGAEAEDDDDKPTPPADWK